MATYFSTQAAKLQTRPQTFDTGLIGGDVKATITTFAAAGALALNDIIHMQPLHIMDRILRIQFASDDLGTGGLFDIGFFYQKDDGTFAVVATNSHDDIADDLDVKTAAVAPVDKRFTALDINGAAKPLWQVAGLSTKPNYTLIWISVKVAEATTAAGDFTLTTLHVPFK